MKDHHIVSTKELQSGQVTTEGRVCEVHGEQVRYYCETEDKQVCIDCVSLKTCPVEHERMTLKEGAKKQVDMIDGLKKKCAAIKKKFQDALKDTDEVLDTFNTSVKCTKSEVVNCKERCLDQVNQVFDRTVCEIEQIQKDRVKDIDSKKEDLKSEVDQMEEAEKQASDFTALSSDFLITYKYSSMSKKLNDLSLLKPIASDKSLGFLAYEGIPMMVPLPGYLLQRERWRLTGQFPTSGMSEPCGIVLNYDGDIAVTSFEKGIKVFSKDGEVKCSFMNDCTKIEDITVSHDNRYIVESGENDHGLSFYTRKGKLLSRVPVTDTNNAKSLLNSVAIDGNDQIIAGLFNNTISIHYADGSLISKFATKHKLFHLAATSEGEIVCSSGDGKCLELMDYTGSNVRVIQPPPEVKKWAPQYVCCRQGEIFVGNTASAGIFQYTSKGQYLGCVTTEVKDPRGIALSQDGMELFVVDCVDCKVKIFHRE